MSNQIFGMSEDRVGNANNPLSYGGLPLAVSNGYRLDPSPSPDSTSPCLSTSPSELDGDSSPDVYALARCVTGESRGDSPYPKFSTLSDVRVNLHQMCFTTPVNESVNIWDQTISLISSQETASLEGHHHQQNSGDSDDDASVVTSQESMERPSPTMSIEALCTSSPENDLPSSREMVMRSNSFNLEDETLPLFSFQEESLMTPGSSSGVFIPEGSFVSPDLPEGCDGLQHKDPMEGLTVERTNPVCFGMMVIQEEGLKHLAEDGKLNTPNLCNVTLPSETELCCRRTFFPESTNSASDAKARPSAETAAEAAQPSALNVTFVQINDNSFASPTPDEQDSAAKAQTSTPVLHLGSHFGLSSFSGSSISGSMDSPAIPTPQDLQVPQTPRQRVVARLSSSSRKAAKIDIQKFPKPDYSGVKSRIKTRLSHQLAIPGTAPAKAMLHNSSKMNGCAKPSQVNLKAFNKVAAAKLRSDPPVVSPTASIFLPKQESAANSAMGRTFIQYDEKDMAVANPPQPRPLGISEAAEGVSRPSLSNSPVTGSRDASSALSRPALSPRSEQAEPSLPAPQSSNATICSSSLLEAPDKDDGVPASPKKTKVSHGDGLRSGFAPCGGTPPLASVRSLDTSTSQSRPSREKRTAVGASSSLNLGAAAPPGLITSQQKAKNPPITPDGSAQDRRDHGAADQMTPDGSSREVRKIRLVEDSPMSKAADASGSSCDQSKGRSVGRGRPSPKQSRVLPASCTAVRGPCPRAGPLPRQQGATGAVQRATKQLQLKQRSPAAHPKAPATDTPTMGAPAPRTKPAVYGSRPPQASGRPSPAGPSKAAVTKAPAPARSAAPKAGPQSDRSRTTGGSSSVAPLRPGSFKTSVLKTRLAKPPGDSGAAFTTSSKSASSSRPGPPRSTIIPPSRSVSSRIAQLASSLPAEKSKAKAGPRPQQQPPQQRGPQGVGARAPPPAAVVGEEDEEGRRKDGLLLELKEILVAEQRKFEAIAVVLQWTLSKRDEVVRRRRELSNELVNLQGELVSSTTSCERLEKEKEEAHASLADALRRLEEQHGAELSQLEARLQLFYQAEWDKVHLTYQEEADKCRTLMEQQIVDLKAKHEATKLDLKADHYEHLQDAKRQYEDSLEELRKTQSDDLQSLQKSLTDADALSGQIRELTEENNDLVEKLKAEEERRKQLAGSSQKDSHTLYLEQELESLKVVLDIKNKQLHQQEKKLLQMDTVVDKSVKLDECLKKVMQENEDLKARMDRHAALSRQLSTEQAVLHQSLQKESKVNKRLSMENEELLWKLQNGEVGSPRRLSPASPSHANSFQSPRSSALFSSPPL